MVDGLETHIWNQLWRHKDSGDPQKKKKDEMSITE